MRRLIVVLAVIAALGGLFAWGLLRGRPDRNISSNLIGKRVPDFEMPLHRRYWQEYGETFSLASYLGKPLVVNFWASWCTPCFREAPVLEALWKQYQDRVLFVGIQTQDRGKTAAGESFLERFSLSFPNGIDDNSRIGVEYGLFGVPETFFIRADGTLAYKQIGELTPQVLQQQLEALLR